MSARWLTIFAVVTGLIVAAAATAVALRQSANQAAFDAQPMFPGLKEHIEEVSRVEVESKEATIVVERKADGGWMLPSRGGWPANFGTVRKTVLALANLVAVELRTARPENHAVLGVADDGPDGQGVRITLFDSEGRMMAALVSGKVYRSPDGTRPGAIYARRAGENQVYLAEGDVDRSLEIGSWLDRALFDIAATRIKSVETTPSVGRPFFVSRETPDDEFVIADIPDGKEPVLPDLARRLAETVALLALDDVMPEDEIAFVEPAISVHHMFDGMVLTTRAVKRDDGRWAQFEASFDLDQAARAAESGLIGKYDRLMSETEVRKMIAEINARTKGWAFRLPGMKGTDLLRDYYSLFRSKARGTDDE